MKNGALWANSRHWLNIRPVYAFGRLVLDNLPLWVGYGVTRGVVEVAYRTGKQLELDTRANLRHVLSCSRPELSATELDREARLVTHRLFINRGRWFADQTVIAGARCLDDLVHVDTSGGWHHFERLRSSGKGAILASAHVGNWPGGGFITSRMGVPLRSILYDNHAGSSMDQGFARRGGISPILIDGDPFTMVEIVRSLQRGQVVAMLVDKPWDARSITLPFFGRPSQFPFSAVRIARLAQVPIFPAFCVNTGRLRYKATLCDPIEVAGDDPEKAEREALEKLVTIIERFVAENLDVWFGSFNPVWKPS